MQRRTQVCRSLIGLAVALLLGSGCRQEAQNTPVAPPVPAPSVAASAAPLSPGALPTPTPDFQPYVLLSQPAPKPAVVTHRHRVLHLARRSGHVYLADTDGHYYQAGRDRQGHIYPIYRDPVTHAAYPLFYDNERDRLYRVVRNDDGHFYRGYIDDPQDRFYADDHDYGRVPPSDSERPIITDSYNNTYNTNNYYDEPVHTAYVHSPWYAPRPAHHSQNNNWLWAIPVIIGAYLLLQPHHHHYSPPRPAAPVTVIVQQRQNNPVTIINNHPVVWTPRPKPPFLPIRPLAAAPLVRPTVPIRPSLALAASRPAVFARPFLRPRAILRKTVRKPAFVYRPAPVAARPVLAVRRVTPPRRIFRPLPMASATHIPAHPRLVRPLETPRPAPVRPAPRPALEAVRPLVRPLAAPRPVVPPRPVTASVEPLHHEVRRAAPPVRVLPHPAPAVFAYRKAPRPALRETPPAAPPPVRHAAPRPRVEPQHAAPRLRPVLKVERPRPPAPYPAAKPKNKSESKPEHHDK